jgi:hypothetical protein
MKGSSIATVILVAIIATVVSALAVNSLLGDPNDLEFTVVYMDKISPNVIEPDREVFNDKAVNPTVEVYVGDCRPGEVWNEDRQVCVEGPQGGEDGDGDEEEE